MSRAERTSELTTLRSVATTFARRGSPRVLTVTVVALAVVRFGLAVGGGVEGPGVVDVLVGAAIVVALGPFEWVVHRWGLHGPADGVLTRRLGVGVDHRRHHVDPDDIDTLLLRPVDAGALVLGLGVVTAVLTGPVAVVSFDAWPGAFLTGWLVAAAALAHYEWTHLLVHARYRPSFRYYRTLERHHRLHHHRNEDHWLGITSRLGDRLFGTLPTVPGEVDQLRRNPS